MRQVCTRDAGAEVIPRNLIAVFYSVMVRVPNLVPGLAVPPLAEPPQDRLERIDVLCQWYFQGWARDDPSGPLPGEYDPNDAHG